MEANKLSWAILNWLSVLQLKSPDKLKSFRSYAHSKMMYVTIDYLSSHPGQWAIINQEGVLNDK